MESVNANLSRVATGWCMYSAVFSNVSLKQWSFSVFRAHSIFWCIVWSWKRDVFSFFSFFRLLFLLNVWSVLHISTACDYFSLSWMSPLSVNVVFFRWTSAMHFYKQLKLVLFEFLSVSFIFFLFSFLNLVIGWMYLFIFFLSILTNVPFWSCFTFSVIHAVYVSQNSMPSFDYYSTCESRSFTVNAGRRVFRECDEFLSLPVAS